MPPSPTSPLSTPAAAQRITLTIDGMHCGRCVAAVSAALADLAGCDVERVAVGAAAVALDPAVASPAAAVSAVRGAGYAARVADGPSAAHAACCSPQPA